MGPLGHEPRGMNQSASSPAVDGPLRIGYVSGDFCMHPVGLFVERIIALHDPAMVKPTLYSNGDRLDELTRRLQASARQTTGMDGWRDVRRLGDRQMAERIRADRIDILVDLAGHTANSRLTVFAGKPAPVQISWLGYFATTGLPTMDFVILDPWHAPPGVEAQFSERIIRLPHNRFCYTPAPFAPAVAPLPMLARGYVSFGSFNNTAKLNEAVLEAWAQILQGVPASRLVLKWRCFVDQPYRAQVTDFFVARGIDRNRLELRGMSPHRELLAEYADIDIALDPFPFSGGYTSCEALWMGVPIVTWPQERVVSRQTWSFLNNIGLPGLAAPDRDAYVRLAIQLAGSPATLGELRATLRERMKQSPLCNAVKFTHHLESAYQLAWQVQARK